MTDPNSTSDPFLQQLLQAVSKLQQDIDEMKKRDTAKGMDDVDATQEEDDATSGGKNDTTTTKWNRKQSRDGEPSAPNSELITRDGEDNPSQEGFGNEGSNSNPAEYTETEDHNSSEDGGTFTVSEEGELFLETIFAPKLKYSTRQAKVAKYGQPNSKYTKCPALGSVVEGILSNEVLKQDKVAYKSQEMWLEAAGPLTACLEKAHEGALTVPEVIPMLRASLWLMGDAAQHHSSLRRQNLLQHLNPHLKKVMTEKDFAKAQPYLFCEDFGQEAKEKLDAAAALRKVV